MKTDFKKFLQHDVTFISVGVCDKEKSIKKVDSFETQIYERMFFPIASFQVL